MSQVYIRKIIKVKELDDIIHVWNNLLECCVDNRSIYLTYEWIRNWWRNFSDNSELNIILIQKSDTTIGIFPLMKRAYRLGIWKFEVLETIGAVNSNIVGFFTTEYQNEVIEAFLTFLSNELANGKLIVKLDLVPDDCAFLELLRTKIPHYSDKLAHNEKTMTIAPYVPIKRTWNTYYSSLSRNRRKKIREIWRGAEKSQRITYKQFQSDDLDSGLNALFALHINRWQSVNIRSSFVRRAVREFYRDIATAFLKNNWLHFSYLTVDGQIASVRFDYIYNNKYYAVTSARDLSWAELNIGHLHEIYLIREALERNLSEYDFLKGGEPYKFYYTDKYRKYQCILIIRNAPLSCLYLLFVRTCLRVVQFILNKHDRKELVALTKYYIKNRILRKKMSLKL